MQLGTTITLDAYRALDAADLESLYVARGPDAIDLAQRVRARFGNGRIAVNGPAGVGKTTELSRAAADLATTHTVLSVAVDQMMDVTAGRPADMYAALDEHLVGRLKAIGQSNQGPRLALLMGATGVSLAEALDVCADRLRLIQSGGTPVVVLADGFEKAADPNHARELIHALLDLCERADAACVVVLSPTAVIGPLASQLVQRVKLVEMRAVGFSGPGDPMETIVPFMRDLLTRRVGPWPPPMDSIVGYAARSSGGLPRVFLQLMSDTLAYAKLRGHEWPTTEDLAEAVADHQDSLRYLLDKGDVEVLAAAAAGSRDVDAGTLARLVANGYLLSGGRGHSQAYYVHPLVRALLPP